VNVSRLQFHAFLEDTCEHQEVREEEEDNRKEEEESGEEGEEEGTCRVRHDEEVEDWNRTAGFQGCSV